MSRGAMPPRRSRGGDDQRIAPARLPICAAVLHGARQDCFHVEPRYSSRLHDLHRSADRVHSFAHATPRLARNVPQSVPRSRLRDRDGVRRVHVALSARRNRDGRGRAARRCKAARRTSGRSESSTCRGDACLELKSLKLYLWSFGTTGSFTSGPSTAFSMTSHKQRNHTGWRWWVTSTFAAGSSRSSRAHVGARSKE